MRALQVMKNIGNTGAKLLQLIVDGLAFWRKSEGRGLDRFRRSGRRPGVRGRGRSWRSLGARTASGFLFLGLNRAPGGRLTGLEHCQEGKKYGCRQKFFHYFCKPFKMSTKGYLKVRLGA